MQDSKLFSILKYHFNRRDLSELEYLTISAALLRMSKVDTSVDNEFGNKLVACAGVMHKSIQQGIELPLTKLSGE